MPLVLYTEIINPLDITRTRIEAGPAFEKHRFAVPLPGETTALEVFARDADSGVLGVSPVGEALQDSVSLEDLPQPPLHLLLLADADLSFDSDTPAWLNTVLQDADALYLLVPRGTTPTGSGDRIAPLDAVTQYLGVSLDLGGMGALLKINDRRTAFALLVRPEFSNATLLADPTSDLLAAHADGSVSATLFSGFSRGGRIPFVHFHDTVSQCRWLMTTHGQNPIAVSLYASGARHERLLASLEGHTHRRTTTIRDLEWTPSAQLPHPYRIDRIEPEGVSLKNAELLKLCARGSLSDLLECSSLRDLVVDDSIWLDCESIAQLNSLRSLSMIGVKIRDFDFLMPLMDLEDLALSRLPFAGIKELERLEGLRSLEVRQVALSSLAFVQRLTQLQSLHVDCVLDPNSSLQQLSGHPSLHTIVLPDRDLENLDPLATLRLRRFESWGSRVSDLKAFAGQHALQKLLLQNTRVRDLSPLVGLKALEELWLLGCPIRDLTPLARCPALRLLDLQYVADADWDGLAALAGLDDLNLLHSGLTDLEPLSELRQLRRLDLRGTAIRSLIPLENLLEIEELVVAETQVNDLDPLVHLPQLRRIVIDSSQVQMASLANLDFVLD